MPLGQSPEVFAVTGPVMYTKCLVDSGMPISIAPQEWLYPAARRSTVAAFLDQNSTKQTCEAFHYVPNPDAINFGAFPKCLMRLGLAVLATFAL